MIFCLRWFGFRFQGLVGAHVYLKVIFCLGGLGVKGLGFTGFGVWV